MTRILAGVVVTLAVIACIWLSSGVETAKGQEPPAGKGKGPVLLLDPDCHPYALLTSMFSDSGYSFPEAAQHAANALGMTGGEDGQNLAGDDGCLVGQLTVIYCTGTPPNQLLTRRIEWINGLCWNQKLSTCIFASFKCEGIEVPWGKVTINNECMGLPEGTCVQIRLSQAPQFINPCPLPGEILNCDCFRESAADPIDCEGIETECCNPSGNNCVCPSGC